MNKDKDKEINKLKKENKKLKQELKRAEARITELAVLFNIAIDGA